MTFLWYIAQLVAATFGILWGLRLMAIGWWMVTMPAWKAREMRRNRPPTLWIDRKTNEWRTRP